jgi:hypothetical protein
MGKITHKTARFELAFGDRSAAQTALRKLSQDSRVELVIRRGRITPQGAWFELEVTGSARRIDGVLRAWAPRSVRSQVLCLAL